MADEKAAPAPNKGLIAGIVGVVAIVVIAIVCICVFGGKKVEGKWTLADMVDKDGKSVEGITDEIREQIKGSSKIEFKKDKKCVVSQRDEETGEYKSIDSCTYDDKKITTEYEGEKEEQEYEFKDGFVYISAGENGKLKYEREK